MPSEDDDDGNTNMMLQNWIPFSSSSGFGVTGTIIQPAASASDNNKNNILRTEFNFTSAKLDIGKLTYEFHLEDQKYSNATGFVADKLKDAKKNKIIQPKDVVLYGFGRIGRLVARELMTRTGKGSQL